MAKKAEVISRTELQTSLNDPDVIICDEDFDILVSSRESSPKNENVDIDFGTSLGSLSLLSSDWGNIYGEEQFSDVHVLLSSGIFPCHKLVFNVRCPNLLKEVNTLYNPHAIDLSHYLLAGAKAFLEYIYTGKTDSISSLTLEERRDTTALAKKYNLQYLHSLISSCILKDELYSKSTSTVPSYYCDRMSETEESKPYIKNKNKVTGTVLQSKCVVLDEPPIVLSDGSCDTVDLKPIGSQSRISTPNSTNKQLDQSRPFGFLSKTSISPDLFELDGQSGNSSLVNDSGSSLQCKRKLGFTETTDEFKRKCVHDSDSNADNVKESVKTLSNVIVTIDSNSEDGRSPKAKNIPKTKFRLDSPKDFHSVNDNINEGLEFHMNLYEDSTLEVSEYVNKEKDDHKVVLSNSSCPTSPFRENIPNNNSSPKTKKSSLDQYLQTSFPSFIGDLSDVECRIKETWKSSPVSSPRPSASNDEVVTPEPNIIIKDATPLANYSDMPSPQLKAELAKFGLKQNMKAKNAKALLRYIYVQTHPVEDSHSSTPTSSKQNTILSSNADKKKALLRNKVQIEVKSQWILF